MIAPLLGLSEIFNGTSGATDPRSNPQRALRFRRIALPAALSCEGGGACGQWHVVDA